jgi:hypothetical protein
MMTTIEVDDTTVHNIVIEELKSSIEILEIDLIGRLDNQSILGIFHNDRLKDIIEIQKHIDAFKLVLDWYEPEWIKNNE